jgi:hypothetical protein
LIFISRAAMQFDFFKKEIAISAFVFPARTLAMRINKLRGVRSSGRRDPHRFQLAAYQHTSRIAAPRSFSRDVSHSRRQQGANLSFPRFFAFQRIGIMPPISSHVEH